MSQALGRVPGKGSSVALFSVTAVPERRYQSVVIGTILTLVAVRFVFAGMAPLSFDESLYWLWSKHIAGGYLDHPPVNPILIRIGTTLFGDTEFGVRAIGVLLAAAGELGYLAIGSDPVQRRQDWRHCRALFQPDDRHGCGVGAGDA